MSGKKKIKHKTSHKKSVVERLVHIVLILIALSVVILTLSMWISGHTVHIRKASVKISGLPSQFDGITLLFASDIESIGGANASLKVFETVRSLEPDLLVLGGDYASASLFQVLNGDKTVEKRSENARQLFEGLASFSAPLGKYCVLGEADSDIPGIEQMAESAGFNVLKDQAVELELNGARIYLAGLGYDTGYTSMSTSFTTEDTVIVAVHDSAAFHGIQASEAANGGPWADLVISGHNHGGQILLFGRTLTKLSSMSAEHLSGWYTENGVHLLVSQGMGCEYANLRFGSSSEIHLITLKCK